MLYETRFPASDEHLMRLANQAIRRARIPADIMTYEECLSSALMGITVGWERYNRRNWQSSLEWLSMQAYYQIMSDCKVRVREMNRNQSVEDITRYESVKTPSAIKEAEREERAQAVNALMSVLSLRDRKIVTLIAVDGLNYKATAKKLRMRLFEVRKRYLAALDKLRLVGLYAAETVRESESENENS